MNAKEKARLLGVVLFCMFTAGSSLSCSVNVLTTFANKNTDEAYLEDAKDLMNQGDYTGALGKIALMTGSLATERSTVMLKASAYAGICGMIFIPFVESFGSMGTTRLFPFLTSQFLGGTPEKIDACATAETLIQSIGTITQRTNDENMFLVLVNFAKIGNILSLYVDPNQDGTPEVGLNPCLETPRATRPTAAVNGDWYTADLRQLGSGITLAIANISAVSSSVNLGSASLTDVSSACTALGTYDPNYNFCSVTDPDDFTPDQLKGIKSMLKEDSVVGLGTNCSGDISVCFCP